MKWSLRPHLETYVFSTGRRLYTFRQVRLVAIERDETTLVVFLDEAIQHDVDTFDKEVRWKEARRSVTRARGRAVEYDVALDRLIAAAHSQVQSTATAFPVGSEIVGIARRFLRQFYPDGAASIIRMRFEDQLAMMESMLRRLDEQRDVVETLHIGHLVSEMQRLVPLFAEELAKSERPPVAFDELKEARLIGHENLLGLIVRVLGAYPRRSEADAEARTVLLAQVRDQNERIKAQRRRGRRTDVEVDPDTGEELLDLDDLLETDEPADA